MPDPIDSTETCRRIAARFIEECSARVPDHVAAWIHSENEDECWNLYLRDPSDSLNCMIVQLWPGDSPEWWSMNLPVWLAKRLPIPLDVPREQDDRFINYRIDALTYEQICDLFVMAAHEYAK